MWPFFVAEAPGCAKMETIPPASQASWKPDLGEGCQWCITYCSSAEGRHCVLFLYPRVMVGVLAHPYVLRLEEL